MNSDYVDQLMTKSEKADQLFIVGEYFCLNINWVIILNRM